ncbi:FadR/GntR family transcriptional regulator [Arthrobacter sp. MYb213]|uniref:FadR/GntR family transcriptional regulator n=1 Tax=Arthrobacter sp. MYb213 TaxID=1848595 RepID=UPI0025709F09|nr:FadR/GntR family transcriptional regulator [Arthrobacter sp. MYb213]
MKPNLTTSLVEHLRERIGSGDIAAGEKLPSENSLIEQHGVSRTVVREAITRLQAEGLVHTRRGAGSFALTPPAQDSESNSIIPRTLAQRRQLLEYRMGFETEAAALAATHHQDHDLLAMDQALRGFEAAAGNASQSMSCDYEFHLALSRSTGNPYFSKAVESFGPVMIAMPRQRLETGISRASDRLGSVMAEHETIRQAVASGNALAAAAAMRVHLGNSISRLESEAGEKH